MTIEKLTSLSAVKQWLKITDTDASDEVLTRGIKAASRFVMTWLGRDTFAGRDYIQNCRGNGSDSMMLRNWPVLSVTSVGVAGSTIDGSTFGNAGMPSAGWTLSDERMAPQSITLYGHHFWYRAPCQIMYRAGYETKQSFVLPTVGDDDDHLTLTTDEGGQWIENQSVLIDNVPATKVDAEPVAGQYAVSEWGVYTFSKLDSGKTALISYGYVPWDIADAVSQIVGLWYKRSDRIGVQSKSLSGGVGESVSFTTANLDDAVRETLQPYQNVVPA